MNKRFGFLLVPTAVLFAFLASLNFSCGSTPAPQSDPLVGAWKGPVQFNSGVYAEINDFEFMRVYNTGGTMTESSNYDGVPPTPPAYGLWKKTSSGHYLARYRFYWNNMPASFEEMSENGGFAPGGWGVLEENIVLSDDGNSYKGGITAVLFDKMGTRIDSTSGSVSAERIKF